MDLQYHCKTWTSTVNRVFVRFAPLMGNLTLSPAASVIILKISMCFLFLLATSVLLMNSATNARNNSGIPNVNPEELSAWWGIPFVGLCWTSLYWALNAVLFFQQAIRLRNEQAMVEIRDSRNGLVPFVFRCFAVFEKLLNTLYYLSV